MNSGDGKKKRGKTLADGLTENELTVWDLMRDSLWARDRLDIVPTELDSSQMGSYQWMSGSVYAPDRDTLRLGTKGMMTEMSRRTGETLSHELVHSHQTSPKGNRFGDYLEKQKLEMVREANRMGISATELQAELIGQMIQKNLNLPYEGVGYGGPSPPTEKIAMQSDWLAREMLGQNDPVARARRLYQRLTGKSAPRSSFER